MSLSITLLWLVALSAVAPAWAAAPVTIDELAKPGRVLLLRHAIAPGTGDPPGFRLGDCATQRNLDATGRKQAAQLGKRIAEAGAKIVKVYAGQWCRTLETAQLLGLGPVTEEPALNSFFGRQDERESRLTAVRELLAQLPADGPPVILVTHQVTVTGLSGIYPNSGGGVILQLNGTTKPRVVGVLKGSD